MARRVSDRAWRNYTRRLEAQRKAAYEDAYGWGMRHEHADMRMLRRMMVEASIHHGRSTSALAASWFDQMARSEGADVAKAVAVNDPAHLRARRMGIVANKSLSKLEAGDLEGFARSIASGVAADVKRQATNTIMLNAQKAGAEFAWIPGGAETCAFCIALASNGWQPAARATAMGEHADHIHDNCECEFAIRFDKDTRYASYDADKYAQLYDDAEGKNAQGKINSIRRDLYAENKDKINEQHRERYAAMHQTEE